MCRPLSENAAEFVRYIDWVIVKEGEEGKIVNAGRTMIHFSVNPLPCRCMHYFCNPPVPRPQEGESLLFPTYLKECNKG